MAKKAGAFRYPSLQTCINAFLEWNDVGMVSHQAAWATKVSLASRAVTLLAHLDFSHRIASKSMCKLLWSNSSEICSLPTIVEASYTLVIAGT